MSNSDPQENASYVDYTQIPAVRYSLVTLWIGLDLITFFGNLLVVLVFSTNRSLYSITNYYILNLAVTDSLVAVFVMPLKLMELATELKIFIKPAMCPVIQFILMTLVFTSLLTLVVISIERYFVIVYPFNSRIFKSRTKTKLMIALTWIVPAMVSTGMLYSTMEHITVSSPYGVIERYHCKDRFTAEQRMSYIMSVTSLFYVLPLAIITFSTVRIIIVLLRPIPELSEAQNRGRSFRQEESKRKVAKMIVVMTIVYIISWSPWYIANTVALFNNFFVRGHFFFIFLLLHLTGFLNSACNPIIYFFMSERIRSGIIKLLRTILCCGRQGPVAMQLRLNDYSSASMHTVHTGAAQFNNNVHQVNLGVTPATNTTRNSTATAKRGSVHDAAELAPLTARPQPASNHS